MEQNQGRRYLKVNRINWVESRHSGDEERQWCSDEDVEMLYTESGTRESIRQVLAGCVEKGHQGVLSRKKEESRVGWGYRGGSLCKDTLSGGLKPKFVCGCVCSAACLADPLQIKFLHETGLWYLARAICRRNADSQEMIPGLVCKGLNL